MTHLEVAGGRLLGTWSGVHIAQGALETLEERALVAGEVADSSVRHADLSPFLLGESPDPIALELASEDPDDDRYVEILATHVGPVDRNLFDKCVSRELVRWREGVISGDVLFAALFAAARAWRFGENPPGWVEEIGGIGELIRTSDSDVDSARAIGVARAVALAESGA